MENPIEALEKQLEALSRQIEHVLKLGDYGPLAPAREAHRELKENLGVEDQKFNTNKAQVNHRAARAYEEAVHAAANLVMHVRISAQSNWQGELKKGADALKNGTERLRCMLE